MNLNNCITSLNNLLTPDFTLLEATAFSSVAANFVNIIGSLVEAYMILDTCTRVSSLELIKNTTNYLTADHLRYPTNEYTQLEAGTRFIVTTNDLMQFLPNDNTLTDLQNDTDNLAMYNGSECCLELLRCV